MDTLNLAFWQQVKREMLFDIKEDFICHASEIFKEAFNGSFRWEIIEYAKEFIEKEKRVDIEAGFVVLFEYKSVLKFEFKKSRQTRLDFIDFMIEKCKENPTG